MDMTKLSQDYPWALSPIIVCPPMLRITLAPLAVAVSRAGGLGFLAGGFDTSDLESHLADAAKLLSSTSPTLPSREHVLPIGVGFLNWGADLGKVLPVLQKYPVAAAWLYAPYKIEDLKAWSDGIRRVSNAKTKIWIQVGSVELALEAFDVCQPDVLVVQGHDAGGHGLAQGASIITLLPEVIDAFAARGIQIPIIAAGGIVDGRAGAACLALGAAGVVMGTRFLLAEEAEVKDGYRREIMRAKDGGVSTVRSTVYDHVRGIDGWPSEYNGRGVVNKTYEDAMAVMLPGENKRLYDVALGKGDEAWGPDGRLTTYAGTGVGLVHEVMPAGEIVKEVHTESLKCLAQAAKRWNHNLDGLNM